jgi:hypothetical protein
MAHESLYRNEGLQHNIFLIILMRKNISDTCINIIGNISDICINKKNITDIYINID